MDMSTIISLITLGAVIIGAVVNISGLVGKREAKAAADARIEVKLDNIYTEVRGIKEEQSGIKSTLTDHEKRITKVEESTKSAHHRIDELKNLKEER